MPRKKRRTPRFYTHEEWKQIFDDWQNSGLTRNAYCEQNDIGFTAFYNWSQKFLNPNTSDKVEHSFQKLPPIRYTPEQWKCFIEDWGKTGLTKEAYCREKDIPYHNFHYWIGKFAESDPSYKTYKLGKRTRPRFYTPEQWKAFVEDWKETGLSREAYCKRKNLPRTSFYHWTLRFKDPDSSEKGSQKRLYTLEQQQEYVKDWEKSGLSREAYSKQKGLASSTFQTWTQKFRDLDSFKKIFHLRQGAQQRRYTSEEWKEFIEEWKRKGLSKEAYCRQKGLASSTFSHWIEKLKSQPPSISSAKSILSQDSVAMFAEQFVPVTLKSSPMLPASSAKQKVEVVLSQGHRLSLEGSFEWESLTPLLTSLLTNGEANGR